MCEHEAGDVDWIDRSADRLNKWDVLIECVIKNNLLGPLWDHIR